jgi:signal transduction histidine kinase
MPGQVAEWGVASDIALEKARLLAHDLGNHLSATLLVLSRICALEPMNERFSDAALSVEHALAATRGLLDLLWDGIGANEVFDPNAIIEANKSLLGRLAGRGMTLSLALDPGIWVVSADPHGCMLALWNLIANARDATNGQGSVKIATADVFLWGQFRGLTGQFVEICVSDEGEGMQTEAQARAFEPLYTTRNDPKHFGLGLTQVHNFASRSQGAAEIESRGVGLGTTVRVYLPRGVKLRPVKSERHRYK